MSEAKSSKGSKAKAATAPKAGSKSESAAPAAVPKIEAKPKDAAAGTPAPADAKAPEAGKDSGTGTATESGTKESGKSAREAVGGKEGVHYGYFSSVRTPAYRSGWDSIWGGSNGADAEEDATDGENGANGTKSPRRSTPKRAAKTRKRRAVTVTLALDDLPPPLKDALEERARAALKKSRISYERRNKAGAVNWHITCRVE